jgi:hypothetical protein
VLVGVHSAAEETVIEPVAMRTGDNVRLNLESSEYVLVVDKLVNLLVSDDYAVFTLWSADAWERDQIDKLIQAVEASGLTFIRGDEEYSPQAAAAHLRLKLSAASPPVTTVDAFIDEVAGRSWTTGEMYRVRLPDGRTVAVAAWLRDQLQPSQVGSTSREAAACPPTE